MSEAPNEDAVAVTETALACAATPPVDPRVVGAPYPSAAASGDAIEHIGAPMCLEHSDGLDDGELPAGTVAAVETRLQRLKRIALFSSRLLTAPSASDNQTSGALGTMWTTADGRRSARLTSTTMTGDDDDAASGKTVVDATDGITDNMATGVGETSIPGRPMMCTNHARCGRASRTQKNYPAYCCDEYASTAGFEHAEHCGYQTALETESHVPGGVEIKLMLNDTTPGIYICLMPARTRSTWSGHKSGPWHPAAHESWRCWWW